MKKYLVLSLALSVFAVSTAFADIELGVYSGKLATGDACSVEVTAFYFEEDLQHPLHERVKVKVGGQEFVLSHPADIDQATGKVGFTHEYLSGVRGMSGGAQAVIMTMAHDADYHGPTGVRLMVDHYRDNARDSDWFCSGMRPQQSK